MCNLQFWSVDTPSKKPWCCFCVKRYSILFCETAYNRCVVASDLTLSRKTVSTMIATLQQAGEVCIAGCRKLFFRSFVIRIGCGAVWYHRGPNGPIRALIGNQYPPRTFKSTKNILSDPFDPFCYPKPAQTVKINVLLKYCLKSEKAVRLWDTWLMFWAESIVYQHPSAFFGHPKFYWISLKHWQRVNAPPTPLNWSKDLEDRESSNPLKIMARWVEPRKRDQKCSDGETIDFDRFNRSKEHSVSTKIFSGHSALRVNGSTLRQGFGQQFLSCKIKIIGEWVPMIKCATA